MSVTDYQIVIFVVIVVATLALGRAGLWLAAIAAVLWTLSMVFTKGLMALQLGTIVLAVLAGLVLRANPVLVVIAIIGAGIVLAINKNESLVRNAAPASVATQPVVAERRTKTNPACRKIGRRGHSCPPGQPLYIPWTDADYGIAKMQPPPDR